MEIQVIVADYNSCNAYIVSEGKSCVVVDVGFDSKPIFEYVKSEGLHIEAVLLTHGHPDHVHVAKDFSDRGVPVYITEVDFEMPKNEFFGLRLKDGFKVFKPTFIDKDVYKFGDIEVRVIHTPGHTKGGVCYLIGDFLFSGDTLFKGNVGRSDLYGGCEKTLRTTLKGLVGVQQDYQVLPGHGEQTSIFHERKYNVFTK